MKRAAVDPGGGSLERGNMLTRPWCSMSNPGIPVAPAEFTSTEAKTGSRGSRNSGGIVISSKRLIPAIEGPLFARLNPPTSTPLNPKNEKSAQEAGVPGARFAKNSGQELWARALTGSPSEHAVLARRSGIRRFMSRVGPLCPEGGV